MKKHFTKDEVDALVPRLSQIMDAIMDARAELHTQQGELEREQRRLALAGGATIDRQAWQRRGEAMGHRTRGIERGLQGIATLGGVAKDLDLGLVDFLGLREGREVNLCWRHGEASIAHWHGLDEGYAARKPL